MTVPEIKYSWLSQPSVFLDISTKCNASCPQCHRTNPNGLGQADWLPEVEWTLDQFKDAFPPSVLWQIPKFDMCGTWGDPLMNRHVDDIIDYILQNSDSYLYINTNGSLRGDEWWWNLGKRSRKRVDVVFDIDGTTQEMHAKYRVGTNLSRILSNMETYTTAGGIASVRTIVFQHNEEYLEDIEKLSREYGANGRYHMTPSDRFPDGSSFEYTQNGKKKWLIKSSVSGEINKRL